MPAIWDNLQHQIFLGSEAFINKLQEKIVNKADLEDIPALQKKSVPKPISFYDQKYSHQDLAITKAFQSGGNTLKGLGI